MPALPDKPAAPSIEVSSSARKLGRGWDYAASGVALAGLIVLLLMGTPLQAEWERALRFADWAIFLLLALEVLLRFTICTSKSSHFQRHWYDLLIFLPLISLVYGVHTGPVGVFTRELAVVTLVFTRMRRSREVAVLFGLNPAHVLVGGFLFVIALGTVWLMLPEATMHGAPTPLVDALFTAASATCVTGLAVRDTATYFSGLGQLVILALVQVGGLGIMTLSATLLLLARRPSNIMQQATLQGALDYDTLADMRKMLFLITGMTFSFEVMGAVGLATAWHGRFPDWSATLWHALFHSVSAFCNAGFSTFSDSLVQFRGHGWTHLIVGALIIAGGLGFAVVNDLGAQARRALRQPRILLPLRIHTRIVLSMSAVLILLGAGVFWAAERTRSGAGLSVSDQIQAAVFHSISARTAGFNTMSVGDFAPVTLLTLMVMMVIGGSPGSAAGGVKTTTVAVLWGTLLSELRRRENPELYRRTIPSDVVRKAVTLFVLALLVILVFTGLLLIVEAKPFMAICFEAVSAFGTVGLSAGITPDLTPAGKVLLTVLMFIGRLGPLTIVYALTRRHPVAHYRYAEERVMIG